MAGRRIRWMLVLLGGLLICAPGPAKASEIRFVEHDYIELHKIKQISRFRSSVGHDYSADDSDESCVSMKHYYMGKFSLDWEDILIFSPVDGTVTAIWSESQGQQIHITSSLYPQYIFKLFHVVLTSPLSVSDTVTAGRILGHHYGAATNSDIAVVMQPEVGDRQLVSFFEVMSDELFFQYQRRGIAAREEMIISQAEREVDPLVCDGSGNFTYIGNASQWMELEPYGGWDPMIMLLSGAPGWVPTASMDRRNAKG